MLICQDKSNSFCLFYDAEDKKGGVELSKAVLKSVEGTISIKGDLDIE